MKTVAQVDDAQELGRYPIPRSLIWTRVMPGFESMAARRVRADMENTASSDMLLVGPIWRIIAVKSWSSYGYDPHDGSRG